MRFNKKLVVFSLILILMLSLSSIVRAAPPRDRSIASDHLELNALDKADLSDSLVDQADPDEDTGEDNDDDDNDDDDTGGDVDSDDGNDITTEHPVAKAIAKHFEVGYEEIKSLHDEGTGFGNLAKALFVAQMMGDTDNLMEFVTDIEQNGWGQVKKGEQVGRVGSLGSIMRNAKKPAPNPADSGESIGATGASQSSFSANGNGAGHGKEKNSGKSNGKAKGKGK